VGVDGVVFVGVHRGDKVHDLVVGHARQGQELEGDVVEGLAVVLHQRARRAVLPVQIRGQAVDQVEVSFQFQDGLFVSHHTNIVPEPLSDGQLRIVPIGTLFAKALGSLHGVKGDRMPTLFALFVVEVKPGPDRGPESSGIGLHNFDDYRADGVLIHHTNSISEP
jgi:hypothetical protein